jgi:predicted  nucleic acid-binding Zn-ribbon protein
MTDIDFAATPTPSPIVAGGAGAGAQYVIPSELSTAYARMKNSGNRLLAALAEAQVQLAQDVDKDTTALQQDSQSVRGQLNSAKQRLFQWNKDHTYLSPAAVQQQVKYWTNDKVQFDVLLDELQA